MLIYQALCFAQLIVFQCGGRLQSLTNVRAFPAQSTVKETAEITGFTPKTVTDCTRKYLEDGIEELFIERRGGRRSENMTYQEEVDFLNAYADKIDAGEIITVKELHEAYQEKLGRSTFISGFYQLLKRHGWRRLMPRPEHPKKADAETIEASKKLTHKSTPK